MTKKINALGIPVRYERVVALVAGGSVGRPHLADALIEMKYVKTRQEAFDRYLKRDGPAYVSADGPAASEIIQLIRSGKGVPVLAHPSYYTTPELLNDSLRQVMPPCAVGRQIPRPIRAHGHRPSPSPWPPSRRRVPSMRLIHTSSSPVTHRA